VGIVLQAECGELGKFAGDGGGINYKIVSRKAFLERTAAEEKALMGGLDLVQGDSLCGRHCW
jgi:hypothetical protein